MSRLAPRLRIALLVPFLAALVTAGPLLVGLLGARLELAGGEVLGRAVRAMGVELSVLLDEDREFLQRELRRLATVSELRFTIIAADGRVVADSSQARSTVSIMDNHLDRPEIVAARQRGHGYATRTSGTVGQRFNYAATRLESPSGRTYYLRIAQPVDAWATIRPQLQLSLLLAFLGALVAVGLTVWWLRRQVSGPFERIVEASRALAAGDRSIREVPVPAARELASLAYSINELAASQRARLGEQRRVAETLRQILDSLEDGVLVGDPEGRARIANQSFYDLLGLRPVSDPDRQLELVQPRALREGIRRALVAPLAEPEVYEVGGLDAPVKVELSSRELLGSASRVVRLRDRSEEERLDAIRRDFVANVSHELKTPLAAVRGYAESLADGIEDARLAERFLGGILDHCARLEALLADLLTLSRMESVDVSEVLESVSLADLADDARRGVNELAESYRVEIELRVALEAEEATLVGDSTALERMLRNLLENGIKYNRAGGRVTLELEAEPEHWLLRVTDTGIGIPRASIDRIFERFYRVDAGRSRREGGTGLGLAIVKHAAQRHGGWVEVSSREGEGAVFEVRLPRALGAPPPAPPNPLPDTRLSHE